jgi:hypothetical protein
MYPSARLRWLFTILLLAVLTACRSTAIAPVPTSTARPTSQAAATSATQPAILPVADGIDLSSLTGRIVFSAGPHPHQDIYVTHADGSGVTRLPIHGLGELTFADWTP